MKTHWTAALFCFVLVPSMSCFWMRNAPVPMPVLVHRSTEAQELVVFLPGRGGHAEDFVKGDFLQVAREAGLQADLAAADAHLAYYVQRMVLVRLKEDVIAPAQKRGKQRIWLVGVSMGGLGALLYAQKHPEDVAGVLLLAPYLGQKKVIKEISRAGGVRAWTPSEPLDPMDHERAVWRWLKHRTAGQAPQTIPIYLGYGTDDSFAPANAMLAATLPPKQVFTRPGGHDWYVWKSLWATFLAGSPIQ